MDDEGFGDDFGSGFDAGSDAGAADVATGGISMGGVLGMLPTASMGMLPSAGRAVGVIATKVGNIRMSKVWAAVKKFGPEFTAAGLGWSVGDLMTMILHSGAMTSRRRRGRGISSRDVRTTRRVVRFVNRISHDIGCVHRPHFARRAK